VSDAELRESILDAAHDGVISFRLAWDALGVSSDPVTIAARREVSEILSKLPQSEEYESW
jgi:hypothetical protein